MRAMVLRSPREPLEAAELADPEPTRDDVLVRVRACGVCRTDLHIADGDLSGARRATRVEPGYLSGARRATRTPGVVEPGYLSGARRATRSPGVVEPDHLGEPKLPLVLGHQTVGEVVRTGEGVEGFKAGDRVGVPWLGWTCGECRYCRAGHENLCERARFTGYDRDGGYAELAVADARYCFALPDDAAPAGLAPLLCAGLIGYRALRFCGDAERLGLYGFGGSAHIICQVARHQGRRVFAVTRGDEQTRTFARDLGAQWAGPSDEVPEALDAAIVFAPAGELVVAALRALSPGGTVVCAGIHMSDIPSFPYEALWRERSIRSVANLTRQDGEELLALAPEVPIRTEITEYPLAEANRALSDLRHGRLRGAAVLTV